MLPEGREVTLTDTVGFIQKLPTTLVEAFKSTLDEIRGADLVLHVIDASSPEREMQMKAVEETLQQIDAQTIPRITVFNKIDLVDDAQAAALARLHPGAVFVSAATGQGCDELIEAIARAATALCRSHAAIWYRSLTRNAPSLLRRLMKMERISRFVFLAIY